MEINGIERFLLRLLHHSISLSATDFFLLHQYHTVLCYFFKVSMKKRETLARIFVTLIKICIWNLCSIFELHSTVSYESENYVKNIFGLSSNYFKINYYIKRCELVHDVIKLWVENWSDLDSVLFSINSSR